jgi:site-specific recombinase
VKRIRVILVVVSALLFPGMGHLVLGKWIRALLFSFSILALFILGLLLEGRLYYVDLSQPIMNLPFLASVSAGLPYLIARSWGYGTGNLQNPSFDYGTTFVIVAGLLNLLVTLNAYDIAIGRKK